MMTAAGGKCEGELQSYTPAHQFLRHIRTAAAHHIHEAKQKDDCDSASGTGDQIIREGNGHEILLMHSPTGKLARK